MPEVILSNSSYAGCAGELIAFRNANRETVRDMGYLDWRYKLRPVEVQPVIVWAKSASGEAIGSMSIVPHTYYADGTRVAVGVLGDISVSEKWRGKGIAGRMLAYLPEVALLERLKFCVVLPNEPAAKPLERAGWKELSRLERYVKILDSGMFLRKRLGSGALSAILAPPMNLLLKATSLETYSSGSRDYRTEVLREPDERFDVLWGEVEKADTLIGERSREFLHWRYARHPLEEYSFFCLCKGERLAGYAVYRSSGGTCYVDDLLSLSEEDTVELLMSMLEHIRKGPDLSEVVLKIQQNRFNGSVLKKFGFSKREGHLRFMAYSKTPGCVEALARHGCYLTAYDKDV